MTPTARSADESPAPSAQLLEGAFRHHHAQLIGRLVALLGPSRLELAEDAAQEALFRAVRAWGVGGIPDNQPAWLFRTARNYAVDVIRREEVARRHSANTFVGALTDGNPELGPEPGLEPELALLVLCCHPELTRPIQVALTLKLVFGLSTPDIARAFLTTEEAVAQRIVRAKRKLRTVGLADQAIDPDRLDAALDVLYLAFNAGYSRAGDPDGLDRILTEEAVRLGRALLAVPGGASPKALAVVALLCLQSSRSAARIGADGGWVTLSHQDRSLWRQDRIGEGLALLASSAAGQALTEPHLLAGIAACHAVAPSYADTDWPRILELYRLLLTLAPGPVVAVNAAVAVGMVEGAVAGLAHLETSAALPTMAAYSPFHAARGQMLARLGRRREAAAAFASAMESAACKGESIAYRRELMALEPSESPD